MIDVNLQTDLANKKERDKIRDAKDKVGDVVKTVENVIDSDNVGGLKENYVNNRFATRGANAVEDNPQLSKALENFESLSAEQKYSVMLKVAETMYKANGFSDAPDIIITNDKTTQRGKDTGVIYINLEQLSSFSAGDLVNVIAHESSHSEVIGESEETFAIEKGYRAKEKFNSPKDIENIDLDGYLSTLEDEYTKEKIRLAKVKENLPEEEGEPYLSFIFASDTLAEPSKVDRSEITFKKNGKAYYKGQEVKVIYTLTSSGIEDKVTIEPVENNKILDLFYGEIGAKAGGKILSKLTKGITKLIGKTSNNVLNKGFSTGKAGEEYLAKSVGGEPQKFFSTSDGARFIDQYVMKDGIAHESKVGYTSLTASVKRQILKDVELMKTNKIEGSTWHFYKSSVTGKIGASKPLLKFLEQNGIKYEIHK